MWIARDKMGPLCLYNTKPTLNEEGNWFVTEDTWCGDNPVWEYLQILTKDDCFTELTWKDEPIEVELVSKKFMDDWRKKHAISEKWLDFFDDNERQQLRDNALRRKEMVVKRPRDKK